MKQTVLTINSPALPGDKIHTVKGDQIVGATVININVPAETIGAQTPEDETKPSPGISLDVEFEDNTQGVISDLDSVFESNEDAVVWLGNNPNFFASVPTITPAPAATPPGDANASTESAS